MPQMYETNTLGVAAIGVMCQLKKGVVSEILKGYNFAISRQISKGKVKVKVNVDLS